MSSAYAHGTGWRRSKRAGFLGMIASWRKWNVWAQQERGSRSKDSFASRSGHAELSSGLSCRFHVCGVVVADHWQETVLKLGHLDAGTIDARISRSKIVQYDTMLTGRTQHVQGLLSLSRKCYPSFAWKKYISERDAYTSWCTNEGLDWSLWWESCNRNSIWSYHDPSIVVDVERLGNTQSSAVGNLSWDSATLKHVCVRVVEKFRT